MKQSSPSTLRNRDVIRDVLLAHAPARGRALETSAGTGQHSLHFAEALPEITWQPTDLDERALASIAAWRDDSGLPNLLPPMRLDVRDDPWAPAAEHPLDLVVSINMIHISPWEAAVGLFAGAGRHLTPGGVLFTYGPYLRDGRFTSESNERFEGWLKGLDASYGQRDLQDLETLAEGCGLVREHIIPMPANNFSVLYRKPLKGSRRS